MKSQIVNLLTNIFDTPLYVYQNAPGGYSVMKLGLVKSGNKQIATLEARYFLTESSCTCPDYAEHFAKGEANHKCKHLHVLAGNIEQYCQGVVDSDDAQEEAEGIVSQFTDGLGVDPEYLDTMLRSPKEGVVSSVQVTVKPFKGIEKMISDVVLMYYRRRLTTRFLPVLVRLNHDD